MEIYACGSEGEAYLSAIDPVLFAMNVDPLTQLRVRLSPYNFCSNNPISRIDLTGALDTDYKSHFIRHRKLTLQRLIGIIINMPKRSLSTELREFFDVLADSKSATKGAFSLQRSKLRPVFFKVWNSFLTKGFYTHYAKEVKRWKGFIVLAVDGSTINLPNKKDVVERFGM